MSLVERNKEIVRRWQVAYNTGNLDALDELLAPDWVTNSWPQDQPQTIENAKAIHRMMLAFSPDVHFTTEELIAERDRVVQRYVIRARTRVSSPGCRRPVGGSKSGASASSESPGGRIVGHFSSWRNSGRSFSWAPTYPPTGRS